MSRRRNRGNDQPRDSLNSRKRQRKPSKKDIKRKFVGQGRKKIRRIRLRLMLRIRLQMKQALQAVLFSDYQSSPCREPMDSEPRRCPELASAPPSACSDSERSKSNYDSPHGKAASRSAVTEAC